MTIFEIRIRGEGEEFDKHQCFVSSQRKARKMVKEFMEVGGLNWFEGTHRAGDGIAEFCEQCRGPVDEETMTDPTGLAIIAIPREVF
jgi:hypothetical protein